MSYLGLGIGRREKQGFLRPFFALDKWREMAMI